MISVTGELVSPMGNAYSGATIRVTATESSVSLLGLSDSVTTGTDGSYTFNLVNGSHDIEVLVDDEYLVQGTVTIDDSTEDSISLETLLTTYASSDN